MRIGIEVEFTGISREKAAKALKDIWWNTKPICITKYPYMGEDRFRYEITDDNEKVWGIVLDKSVHPVVSKGSAVLDLDEYMCELVSPVLETRNENDVKKIYDVLNVIREIGAVVNETCGIHIHVDCPNKVQDVVNIFKTFMRREKQIKSEFGVPMYRLNGYCKEYGESLQKLYNSCEFNTLEEFQKFFYDYLAQGVSRDHPKNPARYYMINMDSIHKLGTIEFRFFNSTLSPRALKDYIGWVEDFMKYYNWL